MSDFEDLYPREYFRVEAERRIRVEMAEARLRVRKDGRTAERQRDFLATLADTGCVSVAAEAAGIRPRSAYRLRRHPAGAGFAKAWDEALMVAAGRLTAIAFERAVVGTPREVWRGGMLMSEMSVPSDKMMMFLLQHLLPSTFGGRGVEQQSVEQRMADARFTLPGSLESLVDVPGDVDMLLEVDYTPMPPRDESA
ncbi:hypothetical protein [Sphingomonas sp. UYP23]